jgi:hypothetical protein
LWFYLDTGFFPREMIVFFELFISQPMKKLFILTVAALLSVANILKAQDIVTVAPQSGDPNFPCAFNFTFSNHNSANKNIDGVLFQVIAGQNILIDQLRLPIHWSVGVDQTDTSVDATSDNGGILPGASMSGFLLDYVDNNYETPVTIKWTALNGGVEIDNGIVQTLCTQYQSYNKLDTASVVPTQSGTDPCFKFTLINRNQEGPQSLPIKYIAFKLANNAGTMRPSKIAAPAGWVVDSVTALSAYFHTDNQVTQPGGAAGPFTVCLRASTLVTSFSFVLSTWDDQHTFIDRDTIFNIANNATGAPSETDSVSTSAPNGCFYTATLKNLHVSNLLPPSRLVRFALYSKTAGVTFASAPNAPQFWKIYKSSGGDTISYTAPFDSLGLAGGMLGQFSFSMAGPTTSPFVVGWETDQGGSPYPPKLTSVSTGTLNFTGCVVAKPATDSAFASTGVAECSYVLRVENAHNIAPQSNVTQVKISIPSGSGLLTATGSSANWDFNTTPAAAIKFQSLAGDPGLSPSTSQDLTFLYKPNTPGQNVTATWSTVDENNTTTGTGTFTVNCTPSVVVCDTFTYSSTQFLDSCAGNKFTLHNNKLADIMSLTLATTNGWLIDTNNRAAGWIVTPAGWTAKLSFPPTSIEYTNSAGLKSGESADFVLKFIGYHPSDAPTDTFAVVATTIDRDGKSCDHPSIDSIFTCLSHLIIQKGVKQTSANIGATNFTVRPNPTQGEVDISFDMNTEEHVLISVFDALGHQVKALSSKLMTPGSYNIPYEMSNLTDGTYYIRMQTTLGVMTKKLVLTK